MGLRILFATSSNLASPWLSPHAANTAWLPGALRERGHDVTVRLIDNPRSLHDADVHGFDVVHVHDWAAPPPPAGATGRNVIHTGYTGGAFGSTGPWIALSTSQERQAGTPALAVFPPAVAAEGAPAVTERTDALAFGFDGHDDYALGAALAIACRAERPLDVVMPASTLAGEPCDSRLAKAESDGFVRVHRIARDEFPMPIATAAAYLAFSRVPFDMGALTALASGTPVVTFSGMPAAGVIISGESGFVCDHPEDAARALERLDLLSPALGRSRASVVFDAAASAARHEGLYERLLADDGVLRIDPRSPRLEPQRAVGSLEPAAVA